MMHAMSMRRKYLDAYRRVMERGQQCLEFDYPDWIRAMVETAHGHAMARIGETQSAKGG